MLYKEGQNSYAIVKTSKEQQRLSLIAGADSDFDSKCQKTLEYLLNFLQVVSVDNRII